MPSTGAEASSSTIEPAETSAFLAFTRRCRDQSIELMARSWCGGWGSPRRRNMTAWPAWPTLTCGVQEDEGERGK